jgi:hypothetical protein
MPGSSCSKLIGYLDDLDAALDVPARKRYDDMSHVLAALDKEAKVAAASTSASRCR